MLGDRVTVDASGAFASPPDKGYTTCKFVHSVVHSFGDVEVARRVNGYCDWPVEYPVAAAGPSRLGEEVACLVEFLQEIITYGKDVYVPGGIHSDAVRAVEFSVAVTAHGQTAGGEGTTETDAVEVTRDADVAVGTRGAASEPANECAIVRELLYPLAPLISYVEVPRTVDCDIPRTGELTVTVAECQTGTGGSGTAEPFAVVIDRVTIGAGSAQSEPADKGACGCKFQHPTIYEVGDENMTRSIGNDAPSLAKLTIT